jgi:ribosomal protein L29
MSNEMTIAEMRKMSVADLDKEIAKSKMELLKTKLQTSSQNSKATHLLKQLRQHIARLQTAKKESK